MATSRTTRVHLTLAYDDDINDDDAKPDLTAVAHVSQALPLTSVAVRPEVGDNCAIVRRLVHKGTHVMVDGAVIELANDILEGHRFALSTIPEVRADFAAL